MKKLFYIWFLLNSVQKKPSLYRYLDTYTLIYNTYSGVPMLINRYSFQTDFLIKLFEVLWSKYLLFHLSTPLIIDLYKTAHES